ncbi:hypothetical protein ACHAWF_013058 [Thalassiosira exigua]
MCQPHPPPSPAAAAVDCATIKVNARLRRSRQWRDRSDRASSADDGDERPRNKGKGPQAKGSKGRRASTKPKPGPRNRRSTRNAKQVQRDDCDDSAASTASTAPVSSDESAREKSPRPSRRRRRPKNSKARRPQVVDVVPELTAEEKARCVGLDCEMVGIGPYGRASRLARVSLVGYDGDVVYDVHVRVEETVTDYRTFVSGITKEDLEGPDAIGFDEARSAVEELIADKVVVGHGLKNDFRVLALRRPWHLVRDTAKYEPFMRTVEPSEATPLYPAGSLTPKKLKVLARDKLGMTVQEEGVPHSPVEDAVAAMELYKKHRGKWERAVAYKVGRTREIEEGRARERSDSMSS